MGNKEINTSWIAICHTRDLTSARLQASNRWLAEIRKADGSNLIILLPDGGPRASITTSAAALTAEAAIDLAKQAIDGKGMK